MARGRRKDHTIPLSRGLIHQRDYRARKAKYVSDLEERCRHAEAENEKLRKELEIAKGGLPVRPAAFSSETVRFSVDQSHPAI
jgi:bZIP transcription factor